MTVELTRHDTSSLEAIAGNGNLDFLAGSERNPLTGKHPPNSTDHLRNMVDLDLRWPPIGPAWVSSHRWTSTVRQTMDHIPAILI